jgi:hypothetical protein
MLAEHAIRRRVSTLHFIENDALENELRTLAQYCGSTALALSMHQHLLAANIWKYKKSQGGEEVLMS